MTIQRVAPSTRLSLARAIEALARAARQGSRPGSIWIVGLIYQGLSLGWTFGFTVALPIARAVLPEQSRKIFQGLTLPRWVSGFFDPLELWNRAEGPRWPLLIVLLLVFLAPFRLVAGLARVAPVESWTSARARRPVPSLANAWRAGKGLSRSALGLWTQVLWMMFLAALFFVGPSQVLLSTLAIGENHPVRALLYGLVIALIAVYGFVLTVLFQLALHSLVQNRRGVGSALLHAWRIVRNDPTATGRATVVDLVLYLVVNAFQWGLIGVTALAAHLVELAGMQTATYLVALPGIVLVLALEAFTGCTRCAFWAQAYRSLGGLSTLAAR